MPRVTEAKLFELRMKYQAAYAAHQSCLRALTEATFGGGVVSAGLVEQEAAALRKLTQIRAELLAALAEEAGAADTAADSPP